MEELRNGSKEKESDFLGVFPRIRQNVYVASGFISFYGDFVGIRKFFSSESMIETVPFLGKPAVKIIFQFMSTIGGFAFAYLPVMFAMAIPLGLVRKEKGIAAFSGFVGYTVMNLAINFYLVQTNRLVDPEQLREAGQGMVLGFKRLKWAFLVELSLGLLSISCIIDFIRCNYQIVLPSFLAHGLCQLLLH